jgi:YVTN family beta-propeller protein
MSRTISKTFNVGVNPSHLAITPDGNYAYVVNNNFYSIPNSYSVTVLNLQKGIPKLTIHDNSFSEPYRIAIDHRGKYAYVTNSGSTSTSIINLHSNKVSGIINGFDGPSAIVLSKNFAYVTNYGAPGGVESGNGTTVSVVDLKINQIIDTIKVDLAPAALVLSPCEKYLYCMCYVDGNPKTGILDIISTRSNKVINTISGFFGPFGIVISGDGYYAYVTNFGSNDFSPYSTNVSVVNLKEGRIVKNIETGIQPSGIAISKDNLYVSNYNALYAKPNFQNLTYGEGTVSIIDLNDNTVIDTISVGQSPSTVVLSPNGKTLYVTKYVQNTVAAICL